MENGKPFVGLTFGFVGDFEWPMNKPYLEQVVLSGGGWLSPSYNHVDVLIVGDDPGSKVLQSKKSNPDVIIWKPDALTNALNKNLRPVIPQPIKSKSIPESYGSY